VAWVFYNLFLHPLANFPGPLLARSSLLWRIYHTQTGLIHYAVDDLHRRYGPVVRVSPGELSFASAASFRDIYGVKAFTKSAFYDMYGSGYDSLCIGSERNPDRHRRMKQNLSAAFASRALSEQEDIVNTCVENFVNKVGKEGAKPEGANMTKWFEMVAFDTLGEMAFGESFGCVKDGK
jgi:cytochrome P450